MRLTEQNVKEVIVDASMQKAVFIFFYMNAPECEKAGNALRSAISDNNAYLSLVEADVSEPVGQAIAGQLGLQSVPTVVIMKNGRPVEALQGDEIVEKLQPTIQKYMPSEGDMLLKAALAEVEKGNIAGAVVKAKEAYTLDPKNIEYKHFYAQICIKDKQLEKAHELLDNAGREEQEMQEYKDLISALALADQAADSPALKELEAKFANDPENADIATSYAAALAEAGKKGKALEILFTLLQKDLSNAEVKKTFLDLLNTMQGDPLQKEYRRKLYTIMY